MKNLELRLRCDGEPMAAVNGEIQRKDAHGQYAPVQGLDRIHLTHLLCASFALPAGAYAFAFTIANQGNDVEIVLLDAESKEALVSKTFQRVGSARDIVGFYFEVQS